MDQVSDVREKTDIIALISEYVPLKKAGRNFKANCPFHTENSPSFFVSPDRQMFHCFGCQKGGDVFTFLMEYEHMEFPEALRYLAKRAGIKLVETGRSSVVHSQKEVLFQINRFAAEFYHYLLVNHPVGKQALAYLKKRNIHTGAITTFKIGFAPQSGTGLMSYLAKKKKVKTDEMLDAGLAVRGRHGVTDFFRGRLMFPLIDHRDNVVGFSGRVLQESDFGPKYINTRDTLVYHKGEHFFGLNVAKDAMRKTDTALLVEGEFDVIACFQEGIPNTIALKGTALTERQVNLLSRYVTRVILALDEDSAGQDALVRSLPLLEKKGLHVSALHIENGKDPADALSSDAGAFKKALKHDIPIYDYLLDKALEKHGKKTGDGKRAVVEFLLPLFAEISNEVVKEHYFKKLSTEIDTSYESLQKEVERKKKRMKEDTVYVPKSQKKSREEMLEEYLLALLLQAEKPHVVSQISEELIGKYLKNERSVQKLIHMLFIYFQDHRTFETKTFEKDLPAELQDSFNKAYLLPLSSFSDTKQYEKEVLTVSRELYQLLLKAKLKDIAKKIREEEKGSNDEVVIHELQQEFNAIASLLSAKKL